MFGRKALKAEIARLREKEAELKQAEAAINRFFRYREFDFFRAYYLTPIVRFDAYTLHLENQEHDRVEKKKIVQIVKEEIQKINVDKQPGS